MQERDTIKEVIRFNTELIKMFTLIAIALATGIVSLLIKPLIEYNTKLLFIFIAGLIILATFVTLTIILIFKNRKNLKRLKNV